ncbi:hypothetical protein [Actinoplanes subglobosus]|uniref:Uncharacterized protein n=1 Tax=Actinoplanes subglobosus TaxID=1547892 RepID=A0ABV8J5Z7_9ACTN
MRHFEALACARHPLTAIDLTVPDGHHLSITPGVAGNFIGYTVTTTTPVQGRAAHRAATILAVAQGRPAPEPACDPAGDDNDPRLVAAFTDALGPHGWEIADWCREGRDYQVKVYTEFGWAGFLNGRPADIAAELAGHRAQARMTLSALRCPSCEARLDPFAEEPRPCVCGSIAWRPLSWENPWESMRGALPYIDGAGDPETVPTLARLTAALAGGCEPAGEWTQDDDDFAGVVEAFKQLVPDAQWTLLNDRPVAVIPMGAALRSGPAMQLLTAATEIGYRLTANSSVDYGRRRTVLRFSASEPIDGHEAWFACGHTDDGLELVVGQPDWFQPFEDNDDHWRAMEETDDWWILRPEQHRRHGAWTVDRHPTEFTYGASALAASRTLAFDALSADVLRATLAEAALVINESRTQLEHHYTQVLS